MGKLQALPAAKVRTVVIWLLVAWILYSCSQLLWLIFAGDDDIDAMPLVSSQNYTQPPPSAKSTVDIAALQGLNLFGKAAENKAAEIKPQVKVLPGVEDTATDTRLNLSLLGVALAPEEGASRAVIAHQGKQAQYAIEDKLPGGPRVTLAKVMVDRVILNNAGRYESLWLFDDKKQGRRKSGTTAQNMRLSQQRQLAQRRATQSPAVNQVSANVKVLDHRRNAEISAVMSEAKERLYSDPLSLADLIQVAPAMQNGKLMGYRISPGKNAKQFTALGLQRGDIVTAINGVTLDDPQNSVKLYQQFRSLTEAQIEVMRGDEQLSLQLSTE